jgi:hypothetical protein
MTSVLTRHVRDFGAAGDPAKEVLAAMKNLLRRRMARRNLLSAWPHFLGYGAPNWDAPGAFDDAVADCYVFAVLTRLEALRNQLRVRDNVDGLIVLNVDHFLLGRQRRYDPVGYAVFGNVRGAVEAAHAAGELIVVGLRRGRLHNQALLRLARGGAGAPATETDLLRPALEDAPGWHEALPHLVETTEKGQDWVGAFLHQLRAAGVEAVHCGDLVSVLATRARNDWAALHSVPRGEVAIEGDDEWGELVRVVAPDSRVEDRDRWEWLKQAVRRRIEGMHVQRRKRESRARVWDALVGLIDEGNWPVAQAELVRRLGVPRQSLSDAFRDLREIVNQVRSAE